MGSKLPLEADRDVDRTAIWRGVSWALLASLALTVMLLLVKLLGQGVPVGQTLLIRQVVIVLLLTPFIAPQVTHLFATDRLGLHVIRACLAAIAMLAGYTAVAHLPLADFTALSFSRALFLTLLAVLFLKEVVSLRRWSGTVLGFVGVLLILGPGTASFSPYALLALLGAFATALIFAIVRALTVSEAPLTIMSYQAILVGVFAVPFAVADWVPLSTSQWLLAGSIGVTGLLAQVASIQALKAAPASLVAPTDYTRLIWALILGFALFAEVPSLKSALGALLIVLSAFWVLTEKRDG